MTLLPRLAKDWAVSAPIPPDAPVMRMISLSQSNFALTPLLRALRLRKQLRRRIMPDATSFKARFCKVLRGPIVYGTYEFMVGVTIILLPVKRCKPMGIKIETKGLRSVWSRNCKTCPKENCIFPGSDFLVSLAFLDAAERRTMVRGGLIPFTWLAG